MIISSNKKLIFSGILLLMMICFVLAPLEIILRYRGNFKTYSEKNGGEYSSYYGREMQGHLFTRPPNDTFVKEKDEFEILYETNSLGLREKESFKLPDGSATRVIAIGDSYVEGMGSSYENSWPRVLEDQLNQKREPVYEIYNAGVAGSDPFFAYMLLKNQLLNFNPNTVILTVNESDLTDYVFRGGMSRFQENNTTVNRDGPNWELLYEYSHLMRFGLHRLFNYHHTLISQDQFERKKKKAIDKLHQVIDSFQEMSYQYNFNIFIIFHPMPNNLKYSNTPEKYGYNSLYSLHKELLKKGVNSFSIWKPMHEIIGKDKEYKYSWPTDGHYNAKGYKVMGEVIYNQISPYLGKTDTAQTTKQ